MPKARSAQEPPPRANPLEPLVYEVRGLGRRAEGAWRLGRSYNLACFMGHSFGRLVSVRRAGPLLAACLLLGGPAARAQSPAPGPAVADMNDTGNDYPTAARAEYVFACMATNGRTQEALRQCACAIDVIAAAVPYSDYEKAETILRMQRSGGYLAQEFRIPATNTMLQQLQEAQAEADFTCF